VSDDIAALKAQLAILMKERQDRNDSVVEPVQNGINSLRAGLVTLDNALPNHDLADLIKRANEFGDVGNDKAPLDVDKTAAFLYAFDRFLGKNGPVVSDFAYLRQLADETHQAALDAKSAPAPVVESDDKTDTPVREN
jgi:hypothetical protein